MRTFILSLLLFATLQGYGQKKKKVDPRDVQIDTLTKANALLTKQLDSVSREQKLYYGVYTTIKEKVLLKDFDPVKLPLIIDSLRASRDSATSSLLSPVAFLKDSLSMMTKENALLKAKVDTMTLAMNTNASLDKNKLMAELKDLKSLLDAKIITQAEYDAKKKLVMDKWQ
jgi:putative oligomerization/nucleic acid binding protein